MSGPTGGAAPMNGQGRAFRITDSTMRDGSHAVAHRFTPEQVRAITAGLDAAGVPVRRQPLQPGRQLFEHLDVEQLANRLRPEQLGEQRRVQRQRRGPPLGQRRVELVEEHPHVAEQQAAGERRGGRRGDLRDRHLARRDVGH